MNIFNSVGSCYSAIIGNGTVIVNGKKINVPKNASVSIQNDKVYVNGKLYNEDKELNDALENSKDINIVIQNSDVTTMNINNCEVEVKDCTIKDLDAGNSTRLKASNVDITRGICTGNACTISVNNVGTDIDTGNASTINVKGDVKGDIDTGNACTINK